MKNIEESKTLNSKNLRSEVSDEELEFYTFKLKKETVTLRFFGLCVVMSFIAIVALLLINLLQNSGQVYIANSAIFGLSASTFLLFLYGSVLLFEIHNKKASSLYNELSDELQWDVRGETKHSIVKERPPLGVRIALRDYINSSTIPIFSSKAGPAIAIIFGTLLAVLANLDWQRLVLM